jgi:hypothetical protein
MISINCNSSKQVFKDPTIDFNALFNSAALLKQEHQDDLRRAARTIVKKVERCIEVDGGIFEHLL